MLLSFIGGKTRISFWIKYGFYINILVVIILSLTFVPGVGSSVKGASRWISLFNISFQPGELIKYTILIVSLSFFDKFNDLSKKEKIKYSVSLLLPFVFLIKQPDYGTFLICFVVLVFVCYMSSFSRKNFYILLTSGVSVGIALLFLESYRIQRIFTFLDPWKNPKTSGFQIIQSYLAFASGGVFGEGLGNSNEKLFYLPEAHNDFIFSVIGEELGFLGVVLVVILFIAFIFLGFKIALRLTSRTSQILVTSIIFLIGFQGLLNMGVVLGLLPTKGLNLPFISYGGSSMVSNFFAIGLVFSAYNQNKKITMQL